jgi:hypothetical protein
VQGYISVDPRDEVKLHQIVRDVLQQLPGDRRRVKAQAEKKGVSQSALVAECLAATI